RGAAPSPGCSSGAAQDTQIPMSPRRGGCAVDASSARSHSASGNAARPTPPTTADVARSSPHRGHVNLVSASLMLGNLPLLALQPARLLPRRQRGVARARRIGGPRVPRQALFPDLALPEHV